mgnify:CR=1 FL=1
MILNQFLILAAVLFCIGIYGVLVRRNGVLVLMSIELMLNAVNLNLIAFSAYLQETSGQIFVLFVITIAAAEVGVGLAIILLLFRNFRSPDLDQAQHAHGFARIGDVAGNAEERRVRGLEQLGGEHRVVFDVGRSLHRVDVFLVEGFDQFAHHLGGGRQGIGPFQELFELHDGLPCMGCASDKESLLSSSSGWGRT